MFCQLPLFISSSSYIERENLAQINYLEEIKKYRIQQVIHVPTTIFGSY